MQRDKLTTSDRLIGTSALALIVCSCLPWFGFEKEFSQHGWNYPVFGVLPALLGLAMLTLVVAGVVTTGDTASGLAPADVVAGCLAVLLIAYKLAVGEKVHSVVGSVSLDPKFGIYLSLVAAVGLAAGGILKAKESRAARLRRRA